jgi:hypothetical protein
LYVKRFLSANNADSCKRLLPETELSPTSSPPGINPAIVDPSRPIRDRLKIWQQELGGPDEEELRIFTNYTRRQDISNDVNRLDGKADEDYGDREQREDEDEDEDLLTVALFLKPGDVVELT